MGAQKHRRRSIVLGLAAGLLLVGPGCDNDGGFAEGFRNDDNYRREVFVQPQPHSTDILWVIDTSCSMRDEQEAVATNFPAFIEFFVERDIPFRMGVTSTNIDEPDTVGLDGQLVGSPAWIDDATEDVEQAFVDRALLGIDERHGDERGLHASYMALGERLEDVNTGFLRPDASLVVLVVSDEPDYSTLGAPDAEDWMDWSGYATWLDALKGPEPEDAQRSHLSAIVGVSEDGLEVPDGCLHGDAVGSGSLEEGALRGDGYIEAALATGGSVQSICSGDWTVTLYRLGLTSAGLRDRFELSEIPMLGSIGVRVEGNEVSSWTYEESLNAIVFGLAAIPEGGEAVSVTYHVESEVAD